MECVRVKATPQTWAFIKLSYSQFFILILIIIFFINQIFQVVQVGKKLNVSLAINVFLLTMAEHYVRGRGVVLHAFISIICIDILHGRQGEREKGKRYSGRPRHLGKGWQVVISTQVGSQVYVGRQLFQVQVGMSRQAGPSRQVQVDKLGLQVSVGSF